MRDCHKPRLLEELHSLGATLISDTPFASNSPAISFLMAAALHLTDFLRVLCQSSEYLTGIITPGELLSAAVRRRPDIVMTILLLHGSEHGKSEFTCISYILELGADPFARLPQSRSIILQAMDIGCDRIVELLLETARERGNDLRLEDTELFDGYTALQQSIALNNRTLFTLLLKFGADVRGTTDRGVTCLHSASDMEDEYFAQSLLNSGAEVNSLSVDGLTPFENAVRKNNLKTATCILERFGERRSEFLGALPPHNLTVLGRVLRRCWKVGPNPIQYLFDQNAADFIVNPTTGDSVFHIVAMDDFHQSRAQYSRNYNAVIRLLLARFPSAEQLNARNKNFLTPLHQMVANANVTGTASLLSAGANANAITSSLRTPLDIAVQTRGEEAPDWVKDGGVEAAQEWQERIQRVISILKEKYGETRENFN